MTIWNPISGRYVLASGERKLRNVQLEPNSAKGWLFVLVVGAFLAFVGLVALGVAGHLFDWDGPRDESGDPAMAPAFRVTDLGGENPLATTAADGERNQ